MGCFLLFRDREAEGYEDFHPRILKISKNLERKGPVADILYSDALRRQMKQKRIRESQQRKDRTVHNRVTSHTEEIVAKKFLKSFNSSLKYPPISLTPENSASSK